jgi:glycosyltransferase involved in cell wall biosynthesis
MASGLDPLRYRGVVVLAQDGPLAEELRGVGVETVVRPLAVLRRASLSAGSLAGVGGRLAVDAVGLGRLARRRGVAVVPSNTSVTLSGAAAARTAGVPHVWHVREIYAGFDRPWQAYRRVLERSAALVCVSDATQRQFDGAAHARVIHDGVAIAAARGGDRDAARAVLGLGEGDFACLVAGRVSDWKGQALIVRALAQPQLAGERAVALIAGDAWPGQERQVEELEALARSLGVADRVRMLGFRDDMANLYAAADVVAIPSTRPDPLPNSALEAAAAGACVVAADHGGLPEIVRDAATGRLFEPRNAGALAAVLSELARDVAQRERLGAAAAADVAERFAPALLCDRVQALYDELLRDR